MHNDACPESGEDIARSLVPELLARGAFPELKACFPLWWDSLKPNIPQSVRSLRFEKAIWSFRDALKLAEKGKDEWRKCQVRDALAKIMWQDLSSFADNREAERTRLTFKWLFDILLAWSDDVDEGEKVDEFFVKFHLDMSDMRRNTALSLAVRERCTKSYIDALTAFRPLRPAMKALRRLLRLDAYESLIQLASQRAIQCWDLKQYKYARQALLAHESAIAMAEDLEREYEQVINERSDRRAGKWMETLNKLVHAADRENGYEYVFGRIAEAAADCRAYITKCIKTFNAALLDDPANIVEDAQSHFRNAAIIAADCDWNLEGEALVRIASTLAKVFRRAGSAEILYRRAIQLAAVHNNVGITGPWFKEAQNALKSEQKAEAEANEARWVNIREAIGNKLSQHLKPIEEHTGNLKEFIQWVWKEYPPLATPSGSDCTPAYEGGSKLPDGLFPDSAAPIVPPARKKAKKEVERVALPKVSNSAFRKVVFRYHPDRGQEGFGEVWRQTAETIVKQLNNRRDKHHELKGMV